MGESTWWECESCGQDRFARVSGETLDLKYSHRQLTVKGPATVSCMCRICGHISTIRLGASQSASPLLETGA